MMNLDPKQIKDLSDLFKTAPFGTITDKLEAYNLLRKRDVPEEVVNEIDPASNWKFFEAHSDSIAPGENPRDYYHLFPDSRKASPEDIQEAQGFKGVPPALPSAGQPPAGQPPTGQPPAGQLPAGPPPAGQAPSGQAPTGQAPPRQAAPGYLGQNIRGGLEGFGLGPPGSLSDLPSSKTEGFITGLLSNITPTSTPQIEKFRTKEEQAKEPFFPSAPWNAKDAYGVGQSIGFYAPSLKFGAKLGTRALREAGKYVTKSGISNRILNLFRKKSIPTSADLDLPMPEVKETAKKVKKVKSTTEEDAKKLTPKEQARKAFKRMENDKKSKVPVKPSKSDFEEYMEEMKKLRKKDAKKVVKKPTKKPTKPVKKAPKKVAKKAPKKVVKKAVKKAAKKPTKKPTKKATSKNNIKNVVKKADKGNKNK